MKSVLLLPVASVRMCYECKTREQEHYILMKSVLLLSVASVRMCYDNAPRRQAPDTG